MKTALSFIAFLLIVALLLIVLRHASTGIWGMPVWLGFPS